MRPWPPPLISECLHGNSPIQPQHRQECSPRPSRACLIPDLCSMGMACVLTLLCSPWTSLCHARAPSGVVTSPGTLLLAVSTWA